MKWLDRTLLRSPIYIGLCVSERAFARELKRLGVEDENPFVRSGWDASTHCYQYSKRSARVAIVCIRSDPKRTGIQVAALLAHEAVHVWQKIRHEMGEDQPGDEQEAYAIQNITQVLCRAYYDLAIRRRRRS